MRSVGQVNTKPELVLRHALHGLGLRYKLHDPRLPGRPDLVFPKYGAVVFVHGCFWHAHECRFGSTPSTRTNFWQSKFDANRKRDALALERLSQQGWRSLVVWECALKPYDAARTDETARWVRQWLIAGRPSTQVDATNITGPQARGRSGRLSSNALSFDWQRH
ncbi:very short patch repair endonuclease [Variovorax sp. J22R24]|uniref:very short patch repair endonuclease n=1 Tax=Variovorax gracilis TaxID=3053502 RepID=UPI002578FFCB|nr:very short patch repair endonuclease [Variovorax sp. J22R24]MDM0109836.1 very short patch repair endonuclease [Variovorax sp. J22R24]